MSDLHEILTPEEYDTLVTLKEKADRLVLDRFKEYCKVIRYDLPRYLNITSIKYNSRDEDRIGRDPLGRYDIQLSYPDQYDYGTDSTIYVPSSILWDLPAAIGKTIEAVEAERAEQDRLEAEAARQRNLDQIEAEKKHIAKLAKKYGYVKK